MKKINLILSINVKVKVKALSQGKYSNTPPDIASKVLPIDWAYSKTALCKKLHPEHLVHLRVRASKCVKMP
jgi:hypothetical protein